MVDLVEREVDHEAVGGDPVPVVLIGGAKKTRSPGRMTATGAAATPGEADALGD